MLKPPESNVLPESGDHSMVIHIPAHPEALIAIRNNIMERDNMMFTRRIINVVSGKEFLRSDVTVSQSPDDNFYHIHNPHVSDHLKEHPEDIDVSAEADLDILKTFQPWKKYKTAELHVQNLKDGYVISIGLNDTNKQTVSWLLRPVPFEELAAVNVLHIAQTLNLISANIAPDTEIPDTALDLIRHDWQVSEDGKWVHIPSIQFSRATRDFAKVVPSRGSTPHGFHGFQFHPVSGDEARAILTQTGAVLYPTYANDGRSTLLRLFRPDPMVQSIFFPKFEVAQKQAAIRQEIFDRII